MPSVDPDGRGICINNILSFRTFSAAFCDSSAAACAFAALAAASSKAVAASNLEPRGQSLHVRPASKVKTPCNHLLKKREWNLRCGVMYGGRVSCLFCGRILVTLFLRAENHKEEATRQKDNRSRVYLCTTWEAQWAEQTHAIVQWEGNLLSFIEILNPISWRSIYRVNSCSFREECRKCSFATSWPTVPESLWTSLCACLQRRFIHQCKHGYICIILKISYSSINYSYVTSCMLPFHSSFRLIRQNKGSRDSMQERR